MVVICQEKINIKVINASVQDGFLRLVILQLGTIEVPKEKKKEKENTGILENFNFFINLKKISGYYRRKYNEIRTINNWYMWVSNI